MLQHPAEILARLQALQATIRSTVIGSRSVAGLHHVSHQSSADTIYELDLLIEPVIESFCEEWGQTMPMVVIAEGIEPETGRVFPTGASEADALVRIILDPVDGTRGLMYDKRSAWSLVGAAPNKGQATKLSDIEVAVMTELPTGKMGWSDVLWAIKGQGASGRRDSIVAGLASASQALPLLPSRASTLQHGFAAVSSFFPGTKALAAELMEYIVQRHLGKADVTQAAIFDDQYISTGGQFYELIVGHDRFNADLRPEFYRLQKQPQGLCCHPYDCATMLIAQEAGVILTDARGEPLDGPLDVVTGMNWAGYANSELRSAIEPLIQEFIASRK